MIIGRASVIVLRRHILFIKMMVIDFIVVIVEAWGCIFKYGGVMANGCHVFLFCLAALTSFFFVVVFFLVLLLSNVFLILIVIVVVRINVIWIVRSVGRAVAGFSAVASCLRKEPLRKDAVAASSALDEEVIVGAATSDLMMRRRYCAAKIGSRCLFDVASLLLLMS